MTPDSKRDELNLNIIGLVPARGGSKGLPRKNIAPVNNKPLIAYTIQESLKSAYIRRTFVSTEDDEIAAVAREYGVEVIPRPLELAGDDTPSLPVLRHAIGFLENEKHLVPDIVVVLQPTSPCRLVIDIDSAIELYLQSENSTVVSACETEHSPFWSFVIDAGRIVPLMPKADTVKRRQQAPKTYRLNGAVYVMSRYAIMEHDPSPFGGDARAYIMPPERSIDIDSQLDLELAQLVLGKRHEHQDR